MDGTEYRVLINNKNSLFAIWGEQAVFHEITSDSLFLVTALAARVLNRLPGGGISYNELTDAICGEAGYLLPDEIDCGLFIDSLVEKRLIKQLQL